MTDQITVTNSGGGAAVTVTDPGPAKPATPEMPEGGFAKYWNADKGVYNWEGHAKEQAWQVANKPAKADTKADTKPANAAAGDASQADIKAATDAAGVDMDAINMAIVRGEDIPADARAKLNAIGINDAVIDAVLESQRAQVEQHFSTVTSFLGGEAGMAKVSAFVTKNFRPEEVEAFNEQLNDPDKWRATAVYLLHQAGLPQGTKGGLIQGTNAAAPATSVNGGYQTDAELQADIRKPEYRRDPQFRAQVEQRLRNSPHLYGAGNPRSHPGGL